jgi:hypothetical protein
MLMAALLLFCRLTILSMFVWSFLGKILDIAAFQEAMVDFRLLPSRWSRALAWMFLGAELLTIILLAIGGKTFLLAGFLLAASLLLLFTLALATVLMRKMYVFCNCFGRAEQHISLYDVVRNLLFVFCSLIGTWLADSYQLPLVSGEASIIGLSALCYVVLITHLADVARTLLRPLSSPD